MCVSCDLKGCGCELLCAVQEKVDALEVLGADVRLVPAVPFTDPKNYNHQVIVVQQPYVCMYCRMVVSEAFETVLHVVNYCVVT